MSNRSDRIRWGIAGLGRIAHKFVNDLRLVAEADILAAGSRDVDRARSFAEHYGIDRAYGSYDNLLRDPDVDIVYVATPHDSHAELSVRALDAGKHVLCEKPLALNRHQAADMVAASERNERFLMEAFWSRFNPCIDEVLGLVRDGEIGEVKYVAADFSFRVEVTPGSRMLDMERGGGSLLDMGVYPVFLAYSVLGTPTGVIASAIFDESGADLQTSMTLEYDDAMAVLYSSFVSQSNMAATISGTEGRITLNPIWHETDSYTVRRSRDDDGMTTRQPRTGKGFYHEIVECHRCIGVDRLESDRWSHRDSLNVMNIVDDVRRAIGLRYPAELAGEQAAK